MKKQVAKTCTLQDPSGCN